jgi:hypothetical protein
MEKLTEGELTEILDRVGIVCESWKRLRFTSSNAAQRIRIKSPTNALELVQFTNVLTFHLEDERDQNIIFWLAEWNMWSEDTEQLGKTLFESLLCTNRIDAGIDDHAGLLFCREVLAWRSFLLVCLLFQWDAFSVPTHGEYYVFLSHDGFVEFITLSSHHFEKLRNRLQHWL